MGRYDFRPARVYQAATLLQQTEKIKHHPPWYKAVENNTPPQILVRPLPVQHTGHRTTTRKPSKLFKPQHITYPEDSLRKTFFTDHPWELARPRVVLEDSGADYRQQQWDSVREQGGHLSGENVIQRQAWLMEQKGVSKDDAYDQARQEFYKERLREDIERRVAKEEAMSTGAYFGRTRIGIGNDLEDNQFEAFRDWAEQEAQKTEQARAAVFSGLDTTPSAEPPSQMFGNEAESTENGLEAPEAVPATQNPQQQ